MARISKEIEQRIVGLNRRLDKIFPVLGLKDEDLIRIEYPNLDCLKPLLVFGKDHHACNEAGLMLLELSIELMEAVADKKPNNKKGAAMMLLKSDMACLCRSCIQLGWQAWQSSADGSVHISVPEEHLWQIAAETGNDEDGRYAEKFDCNYRDYFRLAKMVRQAEEAKREKKYGVTPLSKFYNGRKTLIELCPAELEARAV